MLRHIAGTQMRNIPSPGILMTNDTGAWDFTQKGADQRRFSGYVLPDKDSQLAAMNVHGYILQQRLSAPADRNLFHIDMA